MNCPICNNPMVVKDCSLWRAIDIRRRCSDCKYVFNYLYNSHFVRVGDQTWDWHDGDPLPLGKIAVAIAEARKKLGK